MRTIDMFPIQLGISKIVISEQENQHILQYMSKCNLNGFNNLMTIDKFVLRNDIFANINLQITEHLKYYVNEILGYNAQLKVTQSWINFNHKETSHHTHNHVNSIVSGIIYLTENPPSTVFFNPTPARDLVPSFSKTTPNNSETYSVNGEKHMLVLFPSYLRHGVKKNTSDAIRITLAFNTFYTGVIGDEHTISLLELL